MKCRKLNEVVTCDNIPSLVDNNIRLVIDSHTFKEA